MIETNPWLMAIGSDTPALVLYEDGRVIFRKKSAEGPAKYLWKQLGVPELEELKVKLASFGPFYKARHRIRLSNASDQPETKLFLAIENADLVASIYGINFADRTQRQGRSKARLPPELRKLHAYLSTLAFSGAAEWTGQYVEVIAWNYRYAVNESILWPKHWPGLHSPAALQKEHSTSIFLPGSEMGKLAAFLATKKEKGAVEIDGKKVTVSVRPVFPSEPVWREAFSD